MSPAGAGGAARARVVVLHGARGGPDTNWFPWLQAALGARGVAALRPRFPTPDGQSLASWLAAYGAAVGGLPAAPTVLVGHSLGCALALRLAERAATPFAGLFLAAPFVGALGLPDYDAINATFFADPLDWARIGANKGRHGRCWAGDDDPYVPLPRARAVADRLGAGLEVVPNGGHLGAEAGFDTFPRLFEAVLAACGAGT